MPGPFEHAGPVTDLLQVNRSVSSVPVAVGALIHSCSKLGNLLLKRVHGNFDLVGSMALPCSRMSMMDSSRLDSMATSFIHRQQSPAGITFLDFFSWCWVPYHASHIRNHQIIQPSCQVLQMDQQQ